MHFAGVANPSTEMKGCGRVSHQIITRLTWVPFVKKKMRVFTSCHRFFFRNERQRELRRRFYSSQSMLKLNLEARHKIESHTIRSVKNFNIDKLALP